jgi:ApeA N-terminal domain 1
MVTGKDLTGTLLLADNEIRADLYSYTEFFHIAADQPIYFTAETGQVVSFHSNVDLGTGTTTRGDRRIYHCGIAANTAVVGHDCWTDTDQVKRVSFTVKHSLELLRHKDKFEALGKVKYPTEEHLRVFSDSVKSMKLRAWYGATYGMDFSTPKTISPMFEIEFDESNTVHDYIRHVSCYVYFISFCLGVKLKPESIRIDRLSHDEMMAAIDAHSYIGSHDVHYVWPEEKIDSQDLWVGGSPVRAWDDEELCALRACLVAWMDRAEAWKKAYAMMMTNFALKNVISAERLINACRWFEDIPTAQSQNAISSEDIVQISATATQKAHELGYDRSIRERIASSLKLVKAESSEERFNRLVAKVEEKFGKGILPENAVTHLKRAIQFRGKTAHGHFALTSDKEFAAFSKSTHAMEALCYLLTALDLPISSKGLERTGSNPVLRDYRHAFE